MRKVHYWYADFETTRVNIPSKYKTPKQYYDHVVNPEVPLIYAWVLGTSDEDKTG